LKEHFDCVHKFGSESADVRREQGVIIKDKGSIPFEFKELKS
jgi:hypothetical protein